MPHPISQRNNVHLSGQGTQPMLFAHGFGCSQQMWRLITPAFEGAYRTVLFDYVGSGGSDKTAYRPDRYASLEGYAADIIEICDELDLKEVIFVGHSVSAMIGLLASIRRPELFDRLILVGPSPCYLNDGEYSGGFDRSDIDGLLQTMDKNYIGWSQLLAPKIMGNSDRPELGQELTDSFCSTDPVIARQFAEVTFLSDNRADLKAVRRPSLILQCREDIIAPEAVGHYLQQHLPGSTFRQMEATGHCPHMSAPEETAALIQEYLKTGK